MVYVAALKEVIKKLTIRCYDQGMLLDKIWQGYMLLIEQSLNNFEQTVHKIYKEQDKIKISTVQPAKGVYRGAKNGR